MRILLLAGCLILFSCGRKTAMPVETRNEDSLRMDPKSEVTVDPVNAKNQYGDLTIEQVLIGKDAGNFPREGLTDIKYKVFRRDTLLTEIEIKREEFKSLYGVDFTTRARIWESKILQVDVEKGKVIVTSQFGIPDTDNSTEVICVADMEGNKLFIDSPYGCSPGTSSISFGKIVTCSGIYDYAKPLFEYKACCTVFSDLLNSRTLFYVVAWQDGHVANSNNAFLIDIISKDTLDQFIFKDFTESLGYSSLIDNDKNLGLLSILNSETKALVVWDTLLRKEIFNLNNIKINKDLEAGLNTIEMSNEETRDLLIKFDDRHRPISWRP